MQRKLSLCVINHYDMRFCDRLDVYFLAFLTSTRGRSGWLAALRQLKRTQYPLEVGKLGEPLGAV